jgi:hydroxymethylbilane synthase
VSAGAGRTLRLGTRRSLLALTQSAMVAHELERRVPGLTVELVELVTRGDLHQGDLAAVGGKGLFTEELETGLLDGSLDLAVHSLKDLPVTLPGGLVIAAYPERADPRDALVTDDTDDERGLDGLPAGAVVLTGSLRRRAQLLARRPDLEVRPLRGNVDTRIRKWRELGGPGGVVLAQAGLDRLGERLDPDLPIVPLPAEQMLPAPGQGILAVETKAGSEAEAICARLDDPASRRAADAERCVVAAFGGDCTLPLAAWAREEGERLRLDALLAMPDGTRLARGTGHAADPEAAAEACIAAMRGDGADELLARLRESG